MAERQTPIKQTQEQIRMVIEILADNCHQVRQEDVKTAVLGANSLREEKEYRFDEDVYLAFALANRHFWCSGTKDDISLEPDQELADGLRQLQKSALLSLRIEKDMIPETNCWGQYRHRHDIKLETLGVEDKIIVVSRCLGELINQASLQV